MGTRFEAAVLVCATLACACLARNPDWDGPVADGATTQDRADSTSQPSESSGGGSQDGGPTSESGTAGVASTSSTSGGPPCVGARLALCGELCLDVTADPEACGVGCVSCILLFGPKAECHDGVCMAPSGGDDDRGDD